MQIERLVQDLECRVRFLEISDAKLSEKVENIVDKLEKLTKWVMALVMCILGVLITVLGYLIVYWVKG